MLYQPGPRLSGMADQDIAAWCIAEAGYIWPGHDADGRSRNGIGLPVGFYRFVSGILDHLMAAKYIAPAGAHLGLSEGAAASMRRASAMPDYHGVFRCPNTYQ